MAKTSGTKQKHKWLVALGAVQMWIARINRAGHKIKVYFPLHYGCTVD